MRRQPRLSAYKIELTYRIPEKPGVVKWQRRENEEYQMIMNLILTMLAVASVYLALSIVVDLWMLRAERRRRNTSAVRRVRCATKKGGGGQ